MIPALAVLTACAMAFVTIAGFLLYHGKYGRRWLVWTRND